MVHISFRAHHPHTLPTPRSVTSELHRHEPSSNSDIPPRIASVPPKIPERARIKRNSLKDISYHFTVNSFRFITKQSAQIGRSLYCAITSIFRFANRRLRETALLLSIFFSSTRNSIKYVITKVHDILLYAQSRHKTSDLTRPTRKVSSQRIRRAYAIHKAKPKQTLYTKQASIHGFSQTPSYKFVWPRQLTHSAAARPGGPSSTVEKRSNMSLNVPLRPYEMTTSSMMLGRSLSGHSQSKCSERVQFQRISRYPATLRTTGGRVKDRLIGHAFSLQGEGLEGSYLRESLREFCEQIQGFIEATRLHQIVYQEELRALLDPLVYAMKWADKIERLHAVDDNMVSEAFETLLRSGRLVLPTSVVGLKSTTGGDPTRSAHAILIDIQRDSQGLMAINIYNTGLGSKQHDQSTMGAVSSRSSHFKATYEVRGISLTKANFEAILDFLKKPNHLVNIDSAITGLYKNLSSTGLVVPSGAPIAKGQISGNCSWKCISSFIRSNMTESAYRTFKVYYRSRILLQALEQVTPEGLPVTLPKQRQESRVKPLFKKDLQSSSSTFHSRRTKTDILRAAHVKMKRDVFRLFKHLNESGKSEHAQQIAEHAGFTTVLANGKTKTVTHLFDVVNFVKSERKHGNTESDRMTALRLSSS